jgi:hypothetical protein
VRRGVKGVDERGTGDLTERERNNGMTARRQCGGGGPVRRRGHEAEERGDGGDGVLECAHEGG